jgi:3-phosphoshikimate 1-carboxyvinyltransferase
MAKNWKISPSPIKGILHIPPSKSQSMRALLFALLAKGQSVIHNLLRSPDVEAMLLACSSLGASIERMDDQILITGLNGSLAGAEDIIQAGNSGLILRFIGAISSLSSKSIVITGDHSVRYKRPIAPLLEALTQLGATAYSLREDGGAPILVKGPLYPGMACLNGEDSQPVSALLAACAFAQGPTEIFVTEPGEKPWINLTLRWFQRLGIPYTMHQFDYYKLEGKATVAGFNYTVPADFSSLTYPLAAALVTGSSIEVHGLDFNDCQGDKQILNLLQQMKAPLEVDDQKGILHLQEGSILEGISVDLNDCIDALPLMAVLGCFSEGKTEITGAAIARKKESDRITSIASQLRKMGANLEEHADGLTVYPSPLKGAEVHSCFDHRIALSLAVAALGAKGETLIQEIACVEKSYPNFYTEIKNLGAQIETRL